MSHKYTIVALSLIMTACGSQQSAPERTEQVPDAVQTAQAPIVEATPAPTAEPSVVPIPVVSSAPVPVPVPTETPAPIVTATPEPTPTPSATPCAQVHSDGTYDYTCGLWILNPLNNGVCQAHAAELELINQNGTWYDGTFVVTINAQGGLAWNNSTLNAGGTGIYFVNSQQAGRTSTQVPCYFTAVPAN